MLWHIYHRKGQVFVPTVSKTDAGFFLDSNPVAVLDARDEVGIMLAIQTAVARGNPVATAPDRESFPPPAVLEHAKVKSWSTFEKSALFWKIRLKDAVYQVCPTRKSATGGWETDTSRIEECTTGKDVARKVCEMIAASGPA